MSSNIEADLQRTLKLISANWQMQNNYLDRLTNFIYKADFLDDCLIKIKRTGVNKEYALHRWYYAKQTQQKRKQLLNRLYVVYDAPTAQEKLAMKSNFNLMRVRISTYMKTLKEVGFNEITISDSNRYYRLKSDIIHLN